MWVFLPGVFVSAIRDDGDAERLVLRARIEDDLERLRELIPDLSETRSTPDRDYPFRASATRVGFAVAMARAVFGIDYSNFKLEAHARHGLGRERLYEHVWAAMFDAERKLKLFDPPAPAEKRRRRVRPRAAATKGRA